MRPAYMIVIGETECESKTISLRDRQGEQVSEVSIEIFIEMIRREIDQRESVLKIVNQLSNKE